MRGEDVHLSVEFEDHHSVDTLNALQQRRHEIAEQKTGKVLKGAIPDVMTSPPTGFVNAPATGFEYDIGQLSWDDYIALDSLGYSSRDVTAVVNNEIGAADTIQVDVDDEHISASRFGRGLTLRFSVDGTESTPFNELNDRKPQKIKQQVIERYQRSPAHKALHELAVSLSEVNIEGKTSLTTQWFDAEEDRLGTLGALGAIGAITATPSKQLPETTSIRSILEESANATEPILHEGRRVGTAYSVLDRWRGVTKTVQYDDSTGHMAMSFSVDPSHWYAERANQAGNIESVPFLETKCAEELLDALDKAGLMPHPTYQNEMIRTGEAERFGGVYTQMSREVAKWVDRDERRNVSNLFTLYDPRTHAKGMQYWGFESELIQQRLDSEKAEDDQATEIALIEERLLSIDESAMSDPTKFLLRLAKQSITRDAPDGLPELPVTESDVHIHDGACFDVAGYYLGAADGRDGLKSIQIGDVSLLEKTHGHHTFMLQDPIRFNGVELPQGTLMKQGADGGWVMQRLTPFCFDTEEDQLATGSELSKAYEHEIETIRRIGGATLSTLIGATKKRSQWF